MNILNDKEAKKSIVVSLIASMVFLVFIQPIMTFIWETVKRISLSTSDWLTNGMYKNAALGQRNWIDFILLTCIVLIAASFVSRVLLKVTLLTKKESTNAKLKLMEKHEAVAHLKSEKDKNENMLLKMLNVLTWVARFNWLMVPLFVIPIIYLTFNAYADLQLNTSFNQRLNVLAPYIEDHDIKLLRSKWASMQNRKDFDHLNQYMEKLASERKIVLPKKLLD
jgi:hypothetical protein